LKGRKIVEQCKKCEKKTMTGYCSVFDDPAFFWRDGKECWGFTNDPNWNKDFMQSLEQYKREHQNE